MSFSNNVKKILISAGMAFSIVAIAPAVAHAQDIAPIDTEGIIELKPLSSVNEVDQQIEEALESLVGHQSQEEIDALAELPFTTFLADESGEYVAAVNTGPSTMTRAITQLGPGCGKSGIDTSMCIKTTAGTKYGFVGTGIRSVNIAKVNNATSGSYMGSVTTSNKNIYVLKAWQGVNFPSQTVTKITRG